MSDTPAPEPSVVEETDGPISTTDYPIEPAEEASNETPAKDEETPAEEAPKDDEETHSDEVNESPHHPCLLYTSPSPRD